MAFEELASELSLDASEFVSGADEASSAAEDVSGSVDDVSDSLIDLDAKGAAAGGALAAIGTGAQEALDSTQETRESLGRTAATMGISREEAEELASSMSNATFPLEDAQATMDALAQQGVTTEEEMQDVATAADNIADATGTTAESVAQNAAPALRAMGEDVTDLEEYMDTFTYVSRNTTMEVEDFSGMVRRMGPELEEMGLSVDETAAIMTALEEKGMDSRTAMREFRQAANNAEGDQGELMGSLGLTNEEIESQEEALAEAEGMTKEHATAANESLTTMDKMRSSFDDAKLAAGSFLEPMSAAAPALQAAGIAAMTFSTVNMSAVVPSLTAVMGTLTPLLPIILGLAAAGAALYAAWETDFMGIQGITEDVLGTVKSAIEDVIPPIKTTLVNALETLQDTAETVFEAMQSVAEPVMEWFGNIYSEYFAPLEEEVVATFEVWEGAIRDLVGWAKPYVSRFINGVKDVIESTLGLITDAWERWGDDIKSVVMPLFDTIKSTASTFADNLKEIISGVLSLLRGDFEGFKESITNIVDNTFGLVKDTFSNFTDWISSSWDILSKVDNVMGDVKDSAIGIAGDIYEGIVNALSGVGEAIAGTVRDGFNAVVPDSLDLPEVTVGGQSISVEVAGKEIGADLPEKTVGGGSLDMPQLNTGGVIEEEGLAMLHEGEHVYNPAKADKGNPEPGKSVNITINKLVASNPEQAADELHREFRARNLTR